MRGDIQMEFQGIFVKGMLPYLDPATGMGAAALGLLFFLGAIVLSTLLTRLMRRSAWVMGQLGRKVDQTAANYLIRFKTLLVFLGAALLYASLVPALRSLLGTLLAGAGITALIFGFAAKSTLANLMSGLSLIIYRPVRIGDIVEIEGKYGYIEDITLRHTIMRTWKHERLVVPNEKMDSIILVNHSLIDPKIICTVEIGVSYDTDIALAKRLLLEEASRCPSLLPDTGPPWVRMVAFGDSSITLRVYLWTSGKDEAFLAQFWLLEKVKKRFDQEGVEIPFPYRTLVYKKDLPEARSDEDEAGAAELIAQPPPPMLVDESAASGPQEQKRGWRKLSGIFRRHKPE
jgi:small conductance mechanosensitive channel